jgi:LPXTG-motif cell wall-anchored protein
VVDPPVVAPGDGTGAPGAGAGAGAPGAGAPGSGNGAGTGGAGTSTAAGTTRDGLAYTGSELAAWALPLAGGLVALGAVLLVRARRRAVRLRG